jgi:hypothetical protein
MNHLASKRKERGEITQVDIASFSSISLDELFLHLNSSVPVARSCAATVLGKHKIPEVVTGLCRRLKVEKKLYCRIAVCEALVNIGSLSVQPLLALLGKIGKNRETQIPQKGFKKRSYPLPLDLAARTLCRMGPDILPEMFEFLRQSEIPVELQQAIDVIGHIVYTGRLDFDSGELIQTAVKFSRFPMVQFKITRCLSGFRDYGARQFLYTQLRSDNVGLQLEAARSLILSGMNFPVDGYELFEKSARDFLRL